MVRTTDFIRLPYPPDLTQAGIAVANRRFALSSGLNESNDIDRLRLEVARAGVALAFRRYLRDQRIPYQSQEIQPFTEPEQITVILGGRRVELETRLITNQKRLKHLLPNPDHSLEASILISARLHSSESHSATDLAVFAFAAARVTNDRRDLQQIAESGKPFLCNHIMPEAWRQPELREAPGQLSFRYQAEAPFVLNLHGLGLQQERCVEQIVLQPQTWIESQYMYRSVTCLQSGAIPTARLEVQCRTHRRTYTIMPMQWSNLWVYGQEIIIAGYLPFEEIRSFARAAPSLRLGAASTLELPLANLHSLPLFLRQVSLMG
jgi:hypothetical protein